MASATKSSPIVMSIDASTKDVHEFLVDVLTTFAENRQYSWFDVKDYEWVRPNLEGGTAKRTPEGWANAYGKVRVNRSEEGKRNGNWLPLDVELIAEGFRKIAVTPNKADLGDQARARILGALAIQDAGMIDINDADVILQVAVLGSVIYG